LEASRFTLADYREIIAAGQASGYRFGLFTDTSPDPTERVVYLRHDIDNCVESALIMAELEAESGVAATYFVLVRGENYNPFTAANVARLRRIRGLGHEVGLHFAADQHDPSALAEDIAACIRSDAGLLEAATAAPVRAFSFHNPTENGPFTIDVSGFVNAYADRFFADAHYVSESNMSWRDGSPAAMLASGRHPVVQILVHPLSYRRDFTSDRDVLLWFIRDTTQRLLAVNSAQSRVLREQRLDLADVAAYLVDGDRP
jgi:hypothetical protein